MKIMIGNLHKVAKRTFTLLELIIAMTLTLIIMSTLLYFYKDLSTIGLEMEKLNEAHFYWQYTGSRLADIIPRTVGTGTKENKDFLFYSIEDSSLTNPGSQSLVFAFDNKVSLDKIFSNTVIGRLYIDKRDRLTLAYWPARSRWEENELPPMKKEILKENVKSIAFSFFVPPDKTESEELGNKKSDVEPFPKGAWLTKPWLREYNSLPVMVKILIIPNDRSKNQPEEVTYIFPLVNANARIVYD